MRILAIFFSVLFLSACGGNLQNSQGEDIAEQIKKEAKLAKDVYCQESVQARDRGFEYKCTVVRQDDSVTTVYR